MFKKYRRYTANIYYIHERLWSLRLFREVAGFPKVNINKNLVR